VAAKPAAVATPAPAPAKADAPTAAASQEEVEKSFQDTIKRKAPAVPAKPQRTAEEARAATLKGLGELKQVPALRSLVQGVSQIMGKEGVGIDEIAAFMQKDQALCVRIFSMANSAAVGSEQKIDELMPAIQMLGIDCVRRVAQAVTTLRGAQEMGGGLDWRHLWVHTLATAAVAEELDRRINAQPTSQVYLAGLMHDLGKIALSSVDAEAYRDVIVTAWTGTGRLEEIEVAKLGVDHREAGTLFARANGLPEMVIEVIAHHNDPSKAEQYPMEVALVAMANYLVKARGLGFSGSRLDESDGELADSAAVKVITERTGRPLDVAQLEADLAGFFTTFRQELKSMS
jgi:putative nucleotidyltransferase with HDIG domain